MSAVYLLNDTAPTEIYTDLHTPALHVALPSCQSTNGSLPIASIPGMEATQTIHDVGVEAALELVLVGANRRAREGATARLHATGVEAKACACADRKSTRLNSSH